MNDTVPAYGLWSVVIINSAVFIFAFWFIKPKTKLDWRSLGAFSAFIVAVCRNVRFPVVHLPAFRMAAEQVSGDRYLFSRRPSLVYAFLGFKGNPHLNPIHLVSKSAIFIGFYITYRLARSAPVTGRRIGNNGTYARSGTPSTAASFS